MIVDVRCDDDTTQIARIVQDSEHNYAINFLDRGHSSVFNFSHNVQSGGKEYVSGFSDV